MSTIKIFIFKNLQNKLKTLSKNIFNPLQKKCPLFSKASIF